MGTSRGNSASGGRQPPVAREPGADAPRSPWGAVWDFLLAGRPLVALAAVLFTTTGHTMNLREMGVAQGWVAAEYYSLQSAFLVGLALTMLACPALARRFSCRGLAMSGLVLVMAGSVLNGLEPWAPLSVFVAGRVAAGCGAGMVIYCAPRLLDPRWELPATWAAILLPVAGPGVIGAATMLAETSNWQGGFLFEGAAAAVGLVMLLSMAEAHESPPPAARGSLAYLPALVLAAAAGVYVLHWGQLQGWLESPDIVAASAVGAAAAAAALWLAWPWLDGAALRENGIRLVLFFFGGANQFFHGYTMNSYGGSLTNLCSWQRALLIWPMPIGIAAALALSQLRWRGRHLKLGLAGAFAGLLCLAGGLYLSYRLTMEWPYWDLRAPTDLNWFAAPTARELLPGRFLMGLGVGLLMLAADTLYSADPQREETVRPYLPVMQFLGGGLAAGVLINFLLIGRQVHYSYAADRAWIQAGEMAQRQAEWADELRRAGAASPERGAEVLLYRSVNYEADNLSFASIYAAFLVASLALAATCLVLWVWRWRERPHPVEVSGTPP
jgi:MFS family permease